MRIRALHCGYVLCVSGADVLSGNRVYASAMAEIQRQTDVEQLKEKIETTIVTPVVNQLNSRHIGENAHN